MSDEVATLIDRHGVVAALRWRIGLGLVLAVVPLAGAMTYNQLHSHRTADAAIAMGLAAVYALGAAFAGLRTALTWRRDLRHLAERPAPARTRIIALAGNLHRRSIALAAIGGAGACVIALATWLGLDACANDGAPLLICLVPTAVAVAVALREWPTRNRLLAWLDTSAGARLPG